jgi:hypothetical protein
MSNGEHNGVFFQSGHMKAPRLIKIHYILSRAAVQNRMGINAQFPAAFLAGQARPFFFSFTLRVH